MDRSARHTCEPPTKQIFIPSTNGTALSQSGAFTGYDIDTDAEDAWVVFQVPWNYSELLYFDLICIGLLASASMTVTIDVGYGQWSESSSQQTQGPIQFTLTNVGLDQIRAVDIRPLLIGGGTVSPIKAGDFVGVHAERVAANNDNTDLLVLGVQFAYR